MPRVHTSSGLFCMWVAVVPLWEFYMVGISLGWSSCLRTSSSGWVDTYDNLSWLDGIPQVQISHTHFLLYLS